MIVKSYIELKADELSRGEWRTLFKRLTFVDGEGIEVIAYKLVKGGRVRIPRGAWALLPDHVTYHDRRVLPEHRALKMTMPLDATFDDRSFTGQQAALDKLLSEEQGLVIAQPGFGKTVVALALVAAVNTPWVVFVHTEDIFNQWMDYALNSFESLDIGRIQGKDWSVGDLTIAMVQTVRDQMPRFRRHYADKFGGVIVDEAHHSPAESWEAILNACPAQYRVGFTATETRADGRQALMKHLIGPVIYKHKFELRVRARVIPVKTGFKFSYRGRWDWAPLQAAIVSDEARNKLIADTAMRQVKKGHSTLVLSRRIDHLKNIEAQMLFDWVGNGAEFKEKVKILTGKTARPKRKEMLDQFRSGEIMCLLSTQLADESLDIPRLSRVLLTYPGKHDGKIIQQVGRTLREHEDKQNAVVFDFVDDKIGVLRRQWLQRKDAYKQMKIKIVRRKGEEKEENYGTEAQKRRVVAHRVRERLRKGRVRRRGTRGGNSRR